MGEPFELGMLPNTPKNMSEDMEPRHPCDPCELMTLCYTEGCAFRDKTSGDWSGIFAQCSLGGFVCEACFTDSPCHGFGTADEKDNSSVIDKSTAEAEAEAEDIAGTITDKGA